MKRTLVCLLALLLLGFASVSAEPTLDKIGRSGTLTIGARTGSPPFAYIDKNNRWVGFSIDLVEQFVAPAVGRRLGKTVTVAKKESAPPTRIPLLTSNAVDLIAETMTDTKERRQTVDFSLTFFYTGAQFLVKKGSLITGIESIAGKRVAAQQGATNSRILRERVPTAKLIEFPDQPAAFQALAQGRVEAYTNDGIQLAGLKAKAPNPGDWLIVGGFYSSDPYAMAMRKNEPEFRAIVNGALADAIESGKYFELYDNYFGPKGELPYPMSADMKRLLQSSAAEFRKSSGATPAAR